MARNITCKYTGAAAVLFAAVLASPAAFAYGGHHGGGHHGGGHHGGGHYGGHHGGGHYGGHHGGGHYGGGHYGGHHGGGYYGGGYYGGYSSFYSYCRHWGFRHGDRRCYRAFGGYYYNETDLGISDVKFKDVGGRLVVEGTLLGLEDGQAVQLDLEANSDVGSSCGPIADVQTLATRSLPGTEADLPMRMQGEDSGALAVDLADCPNARRADIGDVQFLDARVDVTQGDRVLTLLCTFTEPTVDGDVAPENVECSAF